MELTAKGKFFRDLESYNNREAAKAVRSALQQMQSAADISKINNLRKLKKFRAFYRVRIIESVWK